MIAKLAGLVLVTPGMPARLKEWAYAGFAIVLVSASAAHASAGDPIANVVEPLGEAASTTGCSRGPDDMVSTG